MESKVKGAICSLQEDVKNHINILSLTSWNTQLIINLVIMASCIGCFLRKSVVWKMCLLTCSYWDISFFVCESEPRRLSLLAWADPRLLCWERQWLFRVPLLPLPFHLLCSYPSFFPDCQASALSSWKGRNWKSNRRKGGNEKPRKEEESGTRCICSECWRSALMST